MRGQHTILRGPGGAVYLRGRLAGVVELVDTPALGAGGASLGGSSPSARMPKRLRRTCSASRMSSRGLEEFGQRDELDDVTLERALLVGVLERLTEQVGEGGAIGCFHHGGRRPWARTWWPVRCRRLLAGRCAPERYRRSL